MNVLLRNNSLIALPTLPLSQIRSLTYRDIPSNKQTKNGSTRFANKNIHVQPSINTHTTDDMRVKTQKIQ